MSQGVDPGCIHRRVRDWPGVPKQTMLATPWLFGIAEVNESSDWRYSEPGSFVALVASHMDHRRRRERRRESHKRSGSCCRRGRGDTTHPLKCRQRRLIPCPHRRPTCRCGRRRWHRLVSNRPSSRASRRRPSSHTEEPPLISADPSDIPVLGDWDGDGDENLGIYRPSEQRFYLFTSTCTGSPMGAAHISFLFGNPGDQPVAGDWDADGVAEVGLYRTSTGFFYWRNALNTGIASGEMFFGDPGDRFVSGDWGSIDGVDTPAVFRPTGATSSSVTP